MSHQNMSHQNIKSDLLKELSTEEQQLISGGHLSGSRRPWVGGVSRRPRRHWW